ncbi:MAG: preprotein translocase subunit SecE [Planctomycetaceae bacterium]|nr:preprotein translocase subunit SecE [Planctomycetaceae bacterium]
MSRGTEEATFLGNLFSGALYKRNQGRLVRRLTAIAIAGIVAFGCWALSAWVENSTQTEGLSAWAQMAIPTVIAVAGIWFAFRVVNYPPFANFLVSVEAELDKVSWASVDYLKRATAVVVCTMMFLGAVLWVYDFLWFQLFTAIGILDAGALSGSTPPVN